MEAERAIHAMLVCKPSRKVTRYPALPYRRWVSNVAEKHCP